jgi:hypothetical protein
MTIQSFPFFDDPNWFATFTLEGVPYVIEFDYNERASSWYMSIADADNVDIYNGVKIVTGFSLLKKCADPRAPPGQIWCMSTTSDGSPPTLYDLIPGGRCGLFYVTSDWIALINAGTTGLTGAALAAKIAANVAALQATLTANAQSSELSSYGQGTT